MPVVAMCLLVHCLSSGSSPKPGNLQELEVYIVDTDECKTKINEAVGCYGMGVRKGMMCSYRQQGQSPCWVSPLGFAGFSLSRAAMDWLGCCLPDSTQRIVADTHHISGGHSVLSHKEQSVLPEGTAVGGEAGWARLVCTLYVISPLHVTV